MATIAPLPSTGNPSPQAHTLAELLQAYERDYLPHLAPRTQYHYPLLFRKLAAQYGRLPLEELTPRWGKAWRQTLSRQYQPDTVRNYMGILSGVLTVAVEDYEWLAANPLRTVRKPPAQKGRLRFLSDEERERLLAACQQSPQPFLYLLVVLAISTGARKNELLQLRWPDIDLERGSLRLAVTKNKQGRAVPVTGLALALLRQHAASRAAASSWVFPRADGYKPVLIDHSWRCARRRAGLQDFVFHDLRHTAASYLAMSGASLREIAEVLGHTNIQRTMKYAHLVASHTTSVVERMTTHIFGEAAEETLP